MGRLASTLVASLLLAGAALAQQGTVQTSSQVELGVQQAGIDTDSSRFSEYRDRSDGFQLFGLWLDLLDSSNGRYLEFAGSNLTRADRALDLRAGRYGRWRFDLDWREIPHLLSNKAQSPYLDRGNGLLELPATVPITFERLATSGPDAPGVLASDQLIADYLGTYLHPVALGSERERARALLSYQGLAGTELRLDYLREQRSGTKVAYGPIGDRPPRTLNVQLAEPLDYRTDELGFTADHAGKRYRVGFRYMVSELDNAIDTLTWRNMFVTPRPGAAFDTWDRAVSTYGRRPLPPDNRFHNASFDFGLDTPLDGRLSVAAAYGILEQDQRLLPYSYAESILVAGALPRSTADAEMRTTFFDVAYALTPVQRLNSRVYYRFYDLDNRTPEDDWFYVTSDTTNLNGTRSFKNKRTNLAYAYDTQSLGVENELRLGFWRGSLGLDLEREEITRAFREADTTENRIEARLRARPNGWFSFRLGCLYGNRDADGYNTFVSSDSYWYARTEANDRDNPQFTFTNHPDMRRYDVSDRERQQVDLVASIAPAATWGASLTARYRDDSFDSDVRPSQPLLGTNALEPTATTPGDQLGLLDDTRRQVAIDAFFTPSPRVSFTVFVSHERNDALQRSLEFDENHKEDPSAVANAELGPWTRAGSQWSADTEAKVSTGGLGLALTIRPERVLLRLDATASVGDTDIVYRGFGVTSASGVPFPDNHQFAFRTPPTLQEDRYEAQAGLDIALSPNVGLTVGYLYSWYDISDWQQEANTPWYESVRTEFLLRDTSRSHQWGNRLVNLGSYLAPGYEGHLGYLSLTCRF